MGILTNFIANILTYVSFFLIMYYIFKDIILKKLISFAKYIFSEVEKETVSAAKSVGKSVGNELSKL